MARKKFRFRLDEKGINEALRHFIADDVERKTHEVAEKVRANIDPDVEVSVHSGTTRRGRPYSMVTIRDPRGKLYEMKRGALSKAAVSSGVDINRYPIV